MASLSPQNSLMLRLLRQGPVHSHDLRREHSIGDPGRRAGELRDEGYPVRSEIARRGGRHGVIYFLGEDARVAAPSPVAPASSGPDSPGSRAGAAHKAPLPRRAGAVTDSQGRRCYFAPPASYHVAPEPGCVWVVDCDPGSPLHGRCYWRRGEAAQLEAVA